MKYKAYTICGFISIFACIGACNASSSESSDSSDGIEDALQQEHSQYQWKTKNQEKAATINRNREIQEKEEDVPTERECPLKLDEPRGEEQYNLKKAKRWDKLNYKQKVKKSKELDEKKKKLEQKSKLKELEEKKNRLEEKKKLKANKKLAASNLPPLGSTDGKIEAPRPLNEEN
jgi:hypothetical protein